MTMLQLNKKSLLLKGLFILVTTFIAILFGLISFTGNLILVGLVAGLVGGVVLLIAPKKTIGLVIVLGLTTPALLDMAGHGASKALWAIAMIALLLWIPGLINLIYSKPHEKKVIPSFIWLALIFVITALISTIITHYSLGEFLGGFKRYFQTFGFLIALSVLVITKQEMDRWLKWLLGIALLQLPFALFERFLLVPLRGGISLGGGEATDVVAGTMGANLVGGSPNAVMATFVLIAFAFIFSRWRVGLLETNRMAILGLGLLFPLVLGETKVVVLMLPLTLLILIRKEILLNPLRYFPAIICIFAVTFALAYFYIIIMLDSHFVEAIKGIVDYNLKEVGYGISKLNRTTVMTFWWELQGWHDPVSFLFGHGLGSSYGSGLQAGHVAARFPGYGISLTTVSTLLWDVGLVGLITYISIFVLAWLEANKLLRQTKQAIVKADLLAIQAAIGLTLFFIVFSDSQINLLVHEIIIALVLGYLVFLIKQHAQKPIALTSPAIKQ